MAVFRLSELAVLRHPPSVWTLPQKPCCHRSEQVLYTVASAGKMRGGEAEQCFACATERPGKKGGVEKQSSVLLCATERPGKKGGAREAAYARRTSMSMIGHGHCTAATPSASQLCVFTAPVSAHYFPATVGSCTAANGTRAPLLGRGSSEVVVVPKGN